MPEPDRTPASLINRILDLMDALPYDHPASVAMRDYLTGRPLAAEILIAEQGIHLSAATGGDER